MRTIHKKISAIFFLGFLILSPELYAMKMSDDIKNPAKEPNKSERYLHGNLISLTDRKLNTSVGQYQLTKKTKIIDHRKSDTPAKVQLTIKNNTVVNVVIYE